MQGPGDPGLLTIKGRQCLENAEVVLFDRLLHPDLLQYCPQAEKIDVGKAPGHTRISQGEINLLLAQKAEQGYTVVRLKGGDPFVFGRGGEEAQALAEAGIPFEIIPGVTSGIAAPAYAGIPVTHREVSSSVTFVAGQGEESLPRLEDLPRNGTLVFYMGVGNLPRLSAGLVNCGHDLSTPVCVIEWGTWQRQRVVTGNLEDIVKKCEDCCIEPTVHHRCWLGGQFTRAGELV